MASAQLPISKEDVLFAFEVVPDMATRWEISSPGELSLKYDISLQNIIIKIVCWSAVCFSTTIRQFRITVNSILTAYLIKAILKASVKRLVTSRLDLL